MGACTTSNYVKLFSLPGDFSCICSYELLKKAVNAAENKNVNYHVGNVLSEDMFYSLDTLENTKKWGSMGVLAIEMEIAALYANAAAGGANALGILTISDSILTGEDVYKRQRIHTVKLSGQRQAL